MDPKSKRICIVGAGVSGLCSIKNCLEENLDAKCYEKSDDIGGLWNYRESAVKNHATVMESTVINTSKEMLAFSDFPPPAEWPNWLHHSLVCKYLKMYAEKFDLMKRIQLNTSVEKIEKVADFESTGRWTVHLSNGKSETFDGVMICSGPFSKPIIPKIEGMETFNGSIIHSQQYRNWEEFENKRVLVIGLGNSCMDISTELAKFVKQVYVSTVRGGWIWSRMGIRGWPTDVRYLTRLTDFIFNLAPKSFLNTYFEHSLNMRIDHSDYGLRPKHRVREQFPVFSDQLPTCMSNGSLIIKDGVKRFQGNLVTFVDNTELMVDAVILCTGYESSFPFLDNSLLPVDENGINLYKFIFPPNLAHATLAFVGFVRSFGGIGPISELQGRWATKIFNRKLQLPSRDRMRKNIMATNERNKKDFFKSPKHLLHVPYIDYMNELSAFIGSKPNLTELLLTDPKLFYACYIGPCTSYTYRLKGPDSWPGARDAILSTLDRIDEPLKTRRGEPAIWKPFDRYLTLELRLFDWLFSLVAIWAWVTFGTENNAIFYIMWTILFTYLTSMAFLTDLFFDVSTSF